MVYSLWVSYQLPLPLGFASKLNCLSFGGGLGDSLQQCALSIGQIAVVSFGNLPMTKRLTKSRDKKLFGVAVGVAEYFDVDPTLVRVAFVVLALCLALPGPTKWLDTWPLATYGQGQELTGDCPWPGSCPSPAILTGVK